MSLQKPLANTDPLVSITNSKTVQQLADAALLGNWFVFLTPEWLLRSDGVQLPIFPDAIAGPAAPKILFRGKETLTLPGANIAPSSLFRPHLVSLTCDKALYRVNHDTIRLLIAAPQHPQTELRITLQLNGNAYTDYPLALDEHGLCLWSVRDLPEGAYVATLQGIEAEPCRFEVAEYRLAALNAELAEQQLSGNTLRYIFAVTAFNQPYTGPVEVELQVDGQRIGERTTLHCNRDGQCRGAVKLAGDGLHTLNIIAGERTATVVLKGAEQQRRESVIISDLGEQRLLSLLPLPQSNPCRGMYISRGAVNTEPFLVRRVVGAEVEITARTHVEMLRAVVVNPVLGTSEEHLYEHVKAEQVLRLPIPQPYGVVLLGAFIDGAAWEGWCAVLRPSDLSLQCEAPKEAKPGSRIVVKLKTGQAHREVPVQLIVKDQRLVAPSDPQVEFAAAIKKNLSTWYDAVGTGTIERQLAQVYPLVRERGRALNGGVRPLARFAMTHLASSTPSNDSAQEFTGPASFASMATQAVPQFAAGTMQPMAAMPTGQAMHAPVASQTTAVAALAKVRLHFPEVVYNNIIKVRGETEVEVTLGEGMTRYTVEAFALSTETMDWQRAETTVQAVQAVYGEMTVSPFVFPGDPVLGRLDVGAASGGAIAEVRHDGEVVPLFFEDGSPVTQGLPMPSGSVVRFPVRPGTMTAMVRDARKGGVDVSERYVTEPGQLRHIVRRTHLLNPGDEVTLQELHALELRPMPSLERPFQLFVEGASQYPYGCVEQTSTKLLAMYIGYISNQDKAEVAREYEAALLLWYKRLQSMYLPGSGYCLYPPSEGGAATPDTHYAPLAVRHQLDLPAAERSGVAQPAIRELLSDIRQMAIDAAAYYKIDVIPQTVANCHDAYRMIISAESTPQNKAHAAAFVRSRLKERQGQTYVDVSTEQSAYSWLGSTVMIRQETAYAAAALFAMKEPSDMPRAIAATNYITNQINEAGRLYSTVDTAAGMALMLELRNAGLGTEANNGRMLLNGQAMSLQESLTYAGKVETVRCVEGIIAVQVTSEIVENWGTYKAQIPVEVRLEKQGQIQQSFKVGDELDLVISVPQYEPGLLVHVCLPDALARIVGGGQVKRFSLDFCEKNVLRVPLAAVGATVLSQGKDAETQRTLLNWLGITEDKSDIHVQHWAVIVRNMFREEQVGNPGMLTVTVE